MQKKNQGYISTGNQLSGRFQKVEVQSIDYVICMYSVDLRYFWKSVTTSENILEKILMPFFMPKNRDDVEKSLLISLRAARSLEKTTIFSFVCWYWSRIWHIIHHRRTNKSLVKKNAIGMMKKSKSILRFSLSIN